MINNLIAYQRAPYIRDLTVLYFQQFSTRIKTITQIMCINIYKNFQGPYNAIIINQKEFLIYSIFITVDQNF